MDRPTDPQDESDRQHIVQLHAYRLWEQRGRPLGTPELDWFAAEREVNASEQQPPQETSDVEAAVKAIGAAVGSVLGSVAGLVESLSHVIGSE